MLKATLSLLFVSVVATGCHSVCGIGNEITIPATDPTAPSVTMDAHFLHQAMVTVTPGTGSPSVTAAGDEVITLLATADDPHGAKDIQIWVEETRWHGATQEGPGLLGVPEASSPDTRTAGATGCTRRLAQAKLDIPQRRQGATALRLRVWATGVNFNDTKVDTAQLTINWP